VGKQEPVPMSYISKSASLSECGMYRYTLERSWAFLDGSTLVLGKGTCCFVMLNPSTADGTQDDPTIRRCINFARSWGYDKLVVRNLFPWRATDPRDLFNAETVIGGDRGNQELLNALDADLVICAWGASVPFRRDLEALEMFSRFPKRLHCLELTKHGKPRHPLYVRADRQPQVFR